MIIIALVLRRASRVVPRKRIIRTVTLIHIIINHRARCPRRIIKWRLYRALCANPFAVNALYRTPAAMRVMQTLRALFEGSTRRGAFVFVRFRQHKTADTARAVNGLVSW